MTGKLQRLIDDVNNGKFDIIKDFFGDMETFLDYLGKKGLIHELDLINNEEEFEYEVNKIALAIKEHNPEKFREYVLSSLSDVTYENGEYYVTLNDKSRLAYLFCDDRRNGMSQSTISEILDGEWDFDFWDTTDNVYRDVIQELNKDNLTYLSKKISNELSDVKVEPETELLEEIAEEQGHPEYVTLTPELIHDRIFNDEDSTESILNETENIKSDLHSLHNRAYANAYEDEVYSGIMDELETFFDMRHSDWITVPSSVNPNKSYTYFKVKINNFDSEISDYLNNAKNHNEPLSNYGDYLSILSENISYGSANCLAYYTPDYADWPKTKENINELFGDYL
jgi:hypothetical protein